MKNILLYLDPYLTDFSMSNHRSIIYKNFFNEFNGGECNVKIYASKSFVENFSSIPVASLILTDLVVWDSVNEYFALSQNNLVPDFFVNKVISDFVDENFMPDIIITNSPSCIPRRIWSNAKIFHYELGFFNRMPFPIFHQLDPLGYCHKSMLSQFPWHIHDIKKSDINKLILLKNDFMSQLQINESEVGSVDAVYVPLPSFNTWSVATECNSKNRIHYLSGIVDKFPGELLIVNEKPQYPLSDYELEEISKFGNVNIVSNSDANGDGSHLSMLCRSVYTFSPSLSLQCIFWGNKLHCPDGASMKTWSLTENKFNKLASYVNRFNFSEFSDTRKVIFGNSF